MSFLVLPFVEHQCVAFPLEWRDLVLELPLEFEHLVLDRVRPLHGSLVELERPARVVSEPNDVRVWRVVLVAMAARAVRIVDCHRVEAIPLDALLEVCPNGLQEVREILVVATLPIPTTMEYLLRAQHHRARQLAPFLHHVGACLVDGNVARL